MFFFISIFYEIKTKEVEYDILSINDFENIINNLGYNKTDYDKIILNLKKVLSDFYVYINITKSRKININPIDLIKELDLINTSNLNYLTFINQVQRILSLTKDLHLNLFYLLYQLYNYVIPIEFNVKSNEEENYLYFNLTNNELILSFFDKNLINQIKNKIGLKILKINNQEPFSYIQNFFEPFLKDEHAQFSYNLKFISLDTIPYTFYPEKFKNIKIEFIDKTIINYDYKIIHIKKQSNKYKKFIIKEIKNNLDNSILFSNLFELEKKYNNQNEKKDNNSLWDLNHENSIKFKVDKDNKVNIIYQNSFSFSNINKTISFFGKIMEEMSKNEYPIIIIESLNKGGNTNFSLIFQKVLNYNSAKTKVKISFGINKEIIELINNKIPIYNIETCKREKIKENEINIDEYEKELKHYRTKIYLLTNSKVIEDELKKYKFKNRKPTEIIIFTDGFSFSTTSFFIKDIQESGNAIIVGYNGIPTKQKKKDKFNSSQSPSIVFQNLHSLFPKNNNIKLLYEYYFILSITYSPSYNDSFQNESLIKIPREFTNEKIDERSNIYGQFNDERYLEFIKEGKRIINKYKEECNPENLNLLLKSNQCFFKNDIFAHGGFQCGKNGKWSNFCVPYYCDQGYYFDNYFQLCKVDSCFSNYKVLVFKYFSLFLAFFCFGLFLVFRKCKKKYYNNNEIIERILS